MDSTVETDRRETDAPLTRAASFAPSTFNAERNTVEVVWSTGAKVDRMDWWTGERWVEELSMDSAAVDLSRLNSGAAPLLNTHSQYDLGSQIGVVERAWLDNGQGRAVVRFSSREDVAPIVRDVRDGIIKNLSVGYRVRRWDVTEGGNGVPATKRAVEWTPYEVSFVPIPADAGATVRSLPPSQPREPAMSEPTTEVRTETPAAPAPAAQQPAAPPAQETRAATLAEIEGFQARAGLPAEFALEQLRNGATVDQVRDAVIDALAARNTAPTPRHTSHITIQRDEGDVLRERMAGGIYAAMSGVAPVEEAREFAGLGLHGLMREIAVLHGVRHAHRLTASDLFDEIVRNQVSSSDFSYVLLNSSNKHLRASFGAMAQTWAGWTDEYEVPDFKTITSAAMSNASEPQVLAEGAEIKRSALSDDGEQFAVQERAMILGLTRKAIVNDDMRAIDRAVRSMSLGAYTALRRAVWGLLTVNYSSTTLGQTMADTYAMVKSDHNNIGTTGALSVSTYNELRKLLTAQTMLKAKSTDSATPVMPPSQVLLLVGPKHEAAALEMLSNQVVPTALAAALNPAYRSSTSIVQDAFLGTAITGQATEPFFLTRGDIPPVEIAYLQGRRTPRATQYEPFNYTGIEFKVEFDFRAYVTEWRSITGNVGT